VFSGIVLILSSVVKFLHPAKAVAYMAFLGYVDEKLFLIAGIELAIAILFLYRPTRVVGALLVSGYLGGAIAAHLADHPLVGAAPIILFNAHHQYLGTLPGLVLLICAWAGLWLHHPELFSSLVGRFDARERDRARQPAGSPADAYVPSRE
jgi:hypothetical protein